MVSKHCDQVQRLQDSFSNCASSVALESRPSCMQGTRITSHGLGASCSGRLAFLLGPLSRFRRTQGMVHQADQPSLEQLDEAGLSINPSAKQILPSNPVRRG
jgi:hypothetical protein